MPDKTKNERKERPKTNLPRPASSVTAASDTDAEPQQVPVTQMEEALKNMQDTILGTINTRFDLLEVKFESLQSSHNLLVGRMDEVDTAVTDHETRLSAAEDAIIGLRKECASLRSKVNDLEGRSRRNNIKFVGIPEGEEKGNPTEFVSTLIPKLLGEINFPKQVIIDRAHRFPLPKLTEVGSGSTVKPRTIMARVHHFQDKEKILRLARQQPLKFGANRIFVFPDYTAEVMDQRRGFRDVMAILRERKIKHSLRFPARLHVHHNGLQKVFTSPGDAMTYIGILQQDTGGD